MDFETLFTEWTASREFAAFIRDGIVAPVTMNARTSCLSCAI